MWVSACAFRVGVGVGVGVGWGGQNNANGTREGSKRRAVRLDVSRPGVLRRFETGYGKQKEEKDVRKRQNNESFDRCFFSFPRPGVGGAAQTRCTPLWRACTLTAGRGVARRYR